MYSNKPKQRNNWNRLKNSKGEDWDEEGGLRERYSPSSRRLRSATTIPNITLMILWIVLVWHTQQSIIPFLLRASSSSLLVMPSHVLDFEVTYSDVDSNPTYQESSKRTAVSETVQSSTRRDPNVLVNRNQHENQSQSSPKNGRMQQKQNQQQLSSNVSNESEQGKSSSSVFKKYDTSTIRSTITQFSEKKKQSLLNFLKETQGRKQAAAYGTTNSYDRIENQKKDNLTGGMSSSSLNIANTQAVESMSKTPNSKASNLSYIESGSMVSIPSNTTTAIGTIVKLDQPNANENDVQNQKKISQINTLIRSTIQPRVYNKWKNMTNQQLGRRVVLPCYPARVDWQVYTVHNKPLNRGFLHLKPYKTGSSTSAGIHLRIARNVAKRQLIQNQHRQRTMYHLPPPTPQQQKPTESQSNDKVDPSSAMNNSTAATTIDSTNVSYTNNMCMARFDHGSGSIYYRNRIVNESFLWTTIRDPTSRAISAFYHFAVSREKVEPTDDNLMSFLLNTTYTEDNYLKTLSTKYYFRRTTHDPVMVINSILDEFNFIALMERMDESAVVLMMLLDIPMADILYLRAKTHGGYDDGGGPTGCQKIVEAPPISDTVKQFLKSKQWLQYIQYDQQLYNAARQSLEKTIAALGRRKFEAKLRKYQMVIKYIQNYCATTAIFPCDANGNFHPRSETDCLWNDSACGTTCLDEVATEFNLW